jgi:predicted site-specific integrase-resolvase
MDQSTLISPQKAAEMLGVAPQTLAVWRCEERYDLAYVKVGSRVRYRISDIERFLRKRTLPRNAA